MDLKSYLLRRVLNSENDGKVRESTKETFSQLSNLVVSRIKRKESANVLLIGSSGNGKNFLIEKVIEEARDQVGNIKVSRISGLVDYKNISTELHFEFDRNEREIVILEGLVQLSNHERWLYGLLEEARQHAKIIIATSTKLDALESLEKRIKSRFASSVMIMTPPTGKEMVEILKDNLTVEKLEKVNLSNEQIEEWNSSVEDIIECCYDDLVEYSNRSLCVQDLQALAIPAIAAINEEDLGLSMQLIHSQIQATREPNLFAGCSVFELIIMLCYCSLRKKGQNPIHFIALYQEYLVWKHQHNQRKYEIPRNEYKKCFERLIQLGVLVYEKQTKGIQKTYLPVRSKAPLAHLSRKLLSCPILPKEVVDKSGKFMAG